MFSQLIIKTGANVILDAEEGTISSRLPMLVAYDGPRVIVSSAPGQPPSLVIEDLPVLQCHFNYVQCEDEAFCVVDSAWLYTKDVVFSVGCRAVLDVTGQPLQVNNIEAEVSPYGKLWIETMSCVEDCLVLAKEHASVTGPLSCGALYASAHEHAYIDVHNIQKNGRIEYDPTASISYISDVNAEITCVLKNSVCLTYLGK